MRGLRMTGFRMRRVIAAVVATIGLVASPAGVLLRAQGRVAPPAADVPDITFEKYTLKNGLEVILSADNLRRVAEKLDLASQPEFAGTDEPQQMQRTIQRILAAV